MSLKSKTIKSAKWSAISSLTVIIFGFLQMTILSRILSTNEFGILSVMTVFFILTDALADFGISNSIIQQSDISIEQMSTLYWVNILFGIFLFVAFFVLSDPLAAWLNIPDVSSLIKMTSLAFIIIPHGQQYRALLQKELNFNVLGKLESIAYIIGFCSAVLIAIENKSAISAVWGYLIIVSCRTMLLSAVGRKLYKPKFIFKLKSVKSNLVFGFYLTADSIVNYINSNMSTILIAKILGPVLTGGYSITYNVAVNPPSKISPIITRVLFPAFSKIQNDPQKLKLNFFKLLSLIGFVNFPALFGLLFLSKEFILLSFGVKWIFINNIMMILCLAGVLRAAANPIGALLMAKARMDLSFKFNLAKIFIFAPILYFGAVLYGLIGVALGFLLCQVVNTIFSYFLLLKPIFGQCLVEYFKSLLLPFLHVIPMCIVLYVMNIYWKQNNMMLMVFSIKILSGAFVYLLTMYLSKNALVRELRGICWGFIK